MSRLTFSLLAALTLAACGSPFEVDLPEQEPRLVVRSLFAADSLITLSIGQSAPVLDDAPLEDVTTATVRLYEDDAFVGEAVYQPNRIRYISNVRARAGRTYRVRVDAPGFAPAEAEDTVPTPVPFEVEVERGDERPYDDGSSDRVDAVTVRFTDPPGDDYYALYGLQERRDPDTGAVSQLFPLGFESGEPALADGVLTDFVVGEDVPRYDQAFFRSVPFDGTTVDLRITVRRFFDPPELVESQFVARLRLAALSETYYRYVRAIESSNGNELLGDVTRVPSNVEGGYGIFAAFAATERVLPD